MQEIDDLVAQGYKVKVRHLRRGFMEEVALTEDVMAFIAPSRPMTVFELRERGFEPAPYGGETLVRVETPNGLRFTARVRCSESDHYCKATGIKLALDRLKNEALAMHVQATAAAATHHSGK